MLKVFRGKEASEGEGQCGVVMRGKEEEYRDEVVADAVVLA